AKAPWSAPRIAPAPIAAAPPSDLTLNQPLVEPVRPAGQVVSHASGFLGAAEVQREQGSGQRSLAFAAVLLFAVLASGLMWMMSGPRGTTAVAMGPNAPLELVSLSHQRQDEKLAVSGLVRNPVAGQPVEKLSAVVFLFDRMGTFITSSRTNVDFLKLGAGDESPFVVSLDAPATVSRYRVSFRTDEGVVPHVDRRGAAPAAAEGEQPVNVTAAGSR
ncbi:MAG: hypothetical protein ACREBP_04820, partial [Sphingomicrobium sp.]